MTPSRCWKWKSILRNALIVGAALTAIAVAGDAPRPDLPLPDTDKQWMGKHNSLTSLVAQASRKPPLDIYFLGDSITEFWPEIAKGVWDTEFSGKRVFNAGVSGDLTQNILYRITYGEFDHIAPKVVVVLAGTNNLGLYPQLPPDDVARGIRRIVGTLHAKSPTSKILVLSILPSGDQILCNRILETNRRVQEVNDGKSVVYLDIYSAFVGTDGRFLAGASLDGTHLSAKGYQIWADAMRPTLQKLLEESGQ